MRESASPLQWLRHRPYAALFPLGLLLGLAGVGHWALYAGGVLGEYRPVFHSLVQVQGFLTCFAAGFLLTMIPRRTATRPAPLWLVLVAGLGPALTAVAAWQRRWTASQVPWLVTVVVLTAWVVGRFIDRGAGRRPPAGFVWIPMALAMGVGGSIATLLPGLGIGPGYLHELGRGLVLQGMFTGLVLGVGSLALPLMTRGEGPADFEATPTGLLAVVGHTVAAGVVAGSFWVERAVDFRAGTITRGITALLVLLVSIGLWRRVLRPGWNARLIRLAAWMVPAGPLIAGFFPGAYLAALHVTFIGGFGLLALAVGMQVALGHGGRTGEQRGRPWPIALVGGLALAAMASRVLMDLDFRRRLLWMTAASTLFVAAGIVWATFLAPSFRPPETLDV